MGRGQVKERFTLNIQEQDRTDHYISRAYNQYLVQCKPVYITNINKKWTGTDQTYLGYERFNRMGVDMDRPLHRGGKIQYSTNQSTNIQK